MRYNLTDAIGLIKDRRTVFPENYSKRKVQREQVEKMLDAANWAPTHGLTEPWRFQVYSGDSVRNLLLEMGRIYKLITPEDKFMESKFQRFQKRADLVSTMVAICMKRQVSGKIPEVEELMATACASQNLMLVATAYGISSFWSTGSVAYSTEIREFLGLNEGERCLGFIYLGYPESPWPSGRRGSVQEKTKWFD